MKATQTILYAAMAGALIASPLQAEEQTTRADRIEAFKENLDLTPEQTEKVQTILQHQRQQVEKVREDSGLTREQKMEKAREVAKTTVDEIRPILTQEQQAKLAAVGEKFREAIQSRVSERRGGTEGSAVKTE
jgi:Spy/CpxP family protein refolding chaperone